jgi:glycerophosphoryl diester phosphodiesterase
MSALALSTIIAFLYPVAASAGDGITIDKLWHTHRNKTIAMSHRGDHKNAPENTLAAFDKAIAAGANIVEVDVRLTSDGRWIVYHNRTIRTHNGARMLVSQCTFNELKELTVSGSRYSIPDQAIPSLDEVLEHLRGRVVVYLDDKMGRPLELAEIIREHEMEDQVFIGINDYADAILMSEFAPDVHWRARVKPIGNNIEKYLLLKPLIIEVNNFSALTPERVDLIHDAGVKIMVNSYGHRESDDFYSIFVEQVGADIIQTDNLDKLLAYLDSLDTV